MIKFDYDTAIRNSAPTQEIKTPADVARTQERERIIALIEAKDEWHYEFSDVSDVIALIKGEIE